MSTNQLLPFANGTTPNVLDYASWNDLAARQTGFQSGIASSQQFNYILAQGGAAGYTIGQLVADYTQQDATLNATTLYAAFKQSLAAFVPQAVADNAINGSKLANGTVPGTKLAMNSVDASKIVDDAVTFGKMNASAIATDEEASAGTATNKLMTPAATAAAIAHSVPTGTVHWYAGMTAPDGYLVCNGAAVSRTAYARLFAAIGTTYGAGDGSTTFNLPNLHHRVIEGSNTQGELGKYVEAGLPDITGQQLLWGYPVMSDSVGAFGYTGSKLNPQIAKGLDTSAETYSHIAFAASRSTATFGRSATVQPSAVRLLAIIRT